MGLYVHRNLKAYKGRGRMGWGGGGEGGGGRGGAEFRSCVKVGGRPGLPS